MKWLYAHIGSVQAALQETPELFAAICVNIAIYVRLGVVDHLMDEFVRQALIRFKSVSEQFRTLFYVVANKCMKVLPFARRSYCRANAALGSGSI
jgi:hypothetical protein